MGNIWMPTVRGEEIWLILRQTVVVQHTECLIIKMNSQHIQTKEEYNMKQRNLQKDWSIKQIWIVV